MADGDIELEVRVLIDQTMTLRQSLRVESVVHYLFSKFIVDSDALHGIVHNAAGNKRTATEQVDELLKELRRCGSRGFHYLINALEQPGAILSHTELATKLRKRLAEMRASDAQDCAQGAVLCLADARNSAAAGTQHPLGGSNGATTAAIQEDGSCHEETVQCGQESGTQ